MKVLLTLQDVEPAVRLNALLEAEGIDTAVVSPLDDMRATIRREKPDIIVFSGDVADPSSIALVKEQLWDHVVSEKNWACTSVPTTSPLTASTLDHANQ